MACQCRLHEHAETSWLGIWHRACSVAVSYKPPMFVTRVRLPACACSRQSSPSMLCHTLSSATARITSSKCIFAWAGKVETHTHTSMPQLWSNAHACLDLCKVLLYSCGAACARIRAGRAWLYLRSTLWFHSWGSGHSDVKKISRRARTRSCKQ